MNLSNFTYFWFSLLHLPISISLMIQPKFITSYLYQAPLYLHDDLMFLLLDVSRILGCYLFFFVCFTFFMITVKDRRTRNAFHLAMSLKCLSLCLVMLFVVLFSDHVWFPIGKWFLFFYYGFGFLLFSTLFYFERRNPITAKEAAFVASEAVSHAVKAATYQPSIHNTPTPPSSSSSFSQQQYVPAPSSASSSSFMGQYRPTMDQQQQQQHYHQAYSSSFGNDMSMGGGGDGGSNDMGGGGLTRRRVV